MVSILKTDKIQASHGSTIEIPSGHVLTAPGHVVQVIQGNTSAVATYSIANNGLSSSILSATITPKFATSKILITGQISGAADSRNHAYWITLHRGSTNIGHGDAGGSRRLCHSGFAQFVDGTQGECLGHGTINFLDSPATTSATTYNVLLSHNSGSSQNFHVNRSDQDGNSGDRPRTMSTLTLMEIAQ